MQWLNTTLHEIYGLFVDDVPFAAAILLWLVAMGITARFLPATASWLALLLCAGLLLLLVESTTRFARGKRR